MLSQAVVTVGMGVFGSIADQCRRSVSRRRAQLHVSQQRLLPLDTYDLMNES
jgi:hypothetical protein